MTPEQFRQFADLLPEPTLLIEGDGTIVAINQATEESFGFSGPKLVGRSFMAIVKDPPDEVARYLRACSRSRKAVLGTVVLSGKGGEITCRAEGAVLHPRSATTQALLLLRLSPKASAITEFVALNQKIVELGNEVRRRQQSERAVAEQVERLRTTLASIGDAVIVSDIDGRITNMNAVAESLTGWKNIDAVGQPLDKVFRIVNEDTREQVENPALRALREGVIVGLANHTVLLARDGTERPIDDSASPIRCKEGEIVGCVLVFRDVSERRRAEKLQAASEAEARRLLQLNQAILANMEEGLYTVDTHGLLTYMNPAAERMFGWTCAELLGRKMHDMTHYKHPDGTPFPIEECAGFAVLNHGTVVTEFEDTFIRKDGSFFPVCFCSGPLRSGSDTVGLVVVFRDTTKQKRAENQMRANEEHLRRLATNLSEADRRKDEFLATLAHELRNPLAPLRNALQILKLTGGNPQVFEQTREMMERQLQQMVRLVDDLLDVSRITRGKIALRKERVGVAAVVQSAAETSRPLIEASKHELSITLPLEPVYVDADVTRLAQVFSNLLNNSAKYTPRGGQIWLTVERQGSDAVVLVRDNGVGIPPQMLPHIFEMFTQVDRTLEQSQGGLGIGLTLVKRLVELHDGTVEARSEGQGLGSEFTVRLPIVIVPTPMEPRGVGDSAYPFLKHRILVVDDNEDSATSLGMLLRIMGNEIQLAHDGLAAVKAAECFQPKVVLLDIGMPKLNGYEAAVRIRQLPSGKDMVLVALTGWGQEDDKRRAQEAGFDHHMVKPVDPATLEKLLAGLEPSS